MQRPSNTSYRIPIARPWLPDADAYHHAVADILRRRFLSNFSKYCSLLEDRASEELDARAHAVASCDLGLVLAWRALGCSGGEVVVPSFTFASTVNALRWNGCRPVFADIDPTTLCVDPRDVEQRITRRTVGIAAVHVFGHLAPTDELEAVADAAGVPLVIDAAHAVGSRTQDGLGPGRLGDASAFSLSGTKLVTGGEGGLVTFRDADVADRFLHLRSYGFIGDYDVVDVGLNGKLSEMNAALAWLMFDRLDEMVERRRALASLYRDRLTPILGDAFQPDPPFPRKHPYKDFVIRLPDASTRQRVEAALDQAGVQTKRYFLPVHRMRAYRDWADVELPVTEEVYGRALCLPMYHDLQEHEVMEICEHVERLL